MPRAQDKETGRFTEVYHDEEIISALEKVGHAGTGTQAVADMLGCTRVAAYNRLSDLTEEGRVTSRKIGGTRVWTLSDDRGEME